MKRQEVGIYVTTVVAVVCWFVTDHVDDIMISPTLLLITAASLQYTGPHRQAWLTGAQVENALGMSSSGHMTNCFPALGVIGHLPPRPPNLLTSKGQCLLPNNIIAF